MKKAEAYNLLEEKLKNNVVANIVAKYNKILNIARGDSSVIRRRS